jgi:EpsG family
MLPYLMVFSLFAIATLFYSQSKSIINIKLVSLPSQNLRWVAVLLVLFVGLRHEVGGDWIAYLELAESLSEQPIGALITLNDPGYLLLNWLGANIWGGIYFVNTLSAILLVWGLVSLSSLQPRPLLTIVVALPYLVIVVGMGYTKQSIAIGMIMLAITALYKNSFRSFFLYVIAAMLFHKTAIVVLPFAVFAAQRNKFLYGLFVLIVGLILSILMFTYASSFWENYVVNAMQSSAAFVRLLMIVLPGIFFIVCRSVFVIPEPSKSYLLGMSWGSFILFSLLVLFPDNSTAIDRLALYWLPLQLIILSNLPSIRFLKGLGPYFCTLIVTFYSFAVLVVWLIFANNAHSWVPYNFYPLILLWL